MSGREMLDTGNDIEGGQHGSATPNPGDSGGSNPTTATTAEILELHDKMRCAIVAGCAQQGVTISPDDQVVLATVFAQIFDGTLGEAVRDLQKEVTQLKLMERDIAALRANQEKISRRAATNGSADDAHESDTDIEDETSTGQPRAMLPKIMLDNLREPLPKQAHLINQQIRLVVKRHMEPHLEWEKLGKLAVKKFLVQVADAFRNGKKISQGWLKEKVKTLLSHYRYRMRAKVRKALWTKWDGTLDQEIQFPSSVTSKFLKTALPSERSVVAHYKVEEYQNGHREPAENASQDKKDAYPLLTDDYKREQKNLEEKWKAILNLVGKPNNRRTKAKTRRAEMMSKLRIGHGGVSIFKGNFFIKYKKEASYAQIRYAIDNGVAALYKKIEDETPPPAEDVDSGDEWDQEEEEEYVDGENVHGNGHADEEYEDNSEYEEDENFADVDGEENDRYAETRRGRPEFDSTSKKNWRQSQQGGSLSPSIRRNTDGLFPSGQVNGPFIPHSVGGKRTASGMGGREGNGQRGRSAHGNDGRPLRQGLSHVVNGNGHFQESEFEVPRQVRRQEDLREEPLNRGRGYDPPSKRGRGNGRGGNQRANGNSNSQRVIELYQRKRK